MDTEKLEALFSGEAGPDRMILCEYGFAKHIDSEANWTHYGACHATCIPRTGLTMIATSSDYLDFDRDLCRKYYDWLINRSPWSPVFQAGLVVKDIEWMLDFGFVFEWPEDFHGLAQNYIWAAYITTRWAWERGPADPRRFFKLVKENPTLEENLIFLWVCQGRTHMTPHVHTMLDETVRNFVAGRLHEPNLNFESKHGADCIWGPQGDYARRGPMPTIKTIEELKKYAEGLDR